MPHQCISCGAVYDDGSKEILHGCSQCKGRLFFFIKKEKLEQLKQDKDRVLNLSQDEKNQIEEDVLDILGDNVESDAPVILDIESIKILKPGRYELDLVNLFQKKQPLIYKLNDGKYVIDLLETFKSLGGSSSDSDEE